MAVRVLVAEDDPSVRESMASLVSEGDDLEVVGVAADAEEAIHLAVETRPDVVVLDVRMPGGGGPRAARAIRKRVPGATVVALSAYDDADAILEMVKAGAAAYLLKDGPSVEIVRTIRRCAGRAQPPVSIPAEATRELLKGEVRPIRVLIADDDENVLDVLASLIATDGGFEVVGRAMDAVSAIDVAVRLRPDVAILDVRMPGGGGSRACREIRRRSPRTAVVALSAHADTDTVLRMLRAGALSYVLKTDSSEELLRSLRSSVEGDASLSPELAQPVARSLVELLERQASFSVANVQRLQRIRRVLEQEAIETVFQPIVDLDELEAVGFEALARFPLAPRRRPDIWFAEAAAVHLLTDLELASIARALDALDEMDPRLFLSLNVSPQTAVCERLTEFLIGAPLNRIVFEITEQTPVLNYERLVNGLQPLRERGARIAVDDAGTGFASLEHIVQLRPEFIKLDVTLVRTIASDATRQALVSALVSFASRTGAALIAEGVERTSQLLTLQNLGTRYGQGYLLGRPKKGFAWEGSALWQQLGLTPPREAELPDPRAGPLPAES